ncbi:hypothetical protein OA78_0712 [Latilactobacillus curvatus]|uniref:hypothetical protein n=1 Tax=Latilactobacillus curvatus TaxID=28038 RepID=UPI000575C9DE|nr:hypothetical protein [Latilactobacillus curvatus]KHO13302.1 hypothetical protein OA78_0712 [Latilactobacillus curvatus]
MDANLMTIQRQNWQYHEPEEQIIAEDYKGDPIYGTDSYLELDGELFMPGDVLDFVKYLGATEVER